jgi:hypothetical protein
VISNLVNRVVKGEAWPKIIAASLEQPFAHASAMPARANASSVFLLSIAGCAKTRLPGSAKLLRLRAKFACAATIGI